MNAVEENTLIYFGRQNKTTIALKIHQLGYSTTYSTEKSTQYSFCKRIIFGLGAIR